MSRGWSKIYIGVGAAFILFGAIALWKSWGIWSTHIAYLFVGMLLILTGISSVLGIRDKKVIRGLRYSFAGVAIVFIVIGLVLLIRS